MLRSASVTLLLLALSSVASADIIYQYTGAPFDTISGNWNQVFGATPTHITAIVDVANPFPPFDPVSDPGFVGNFGPVGFTNGINWATISDGIRTVTPDTIFLSGFGTDIIQWRIGGGTFLLQGSSDDRAITTSNIPSGGGFGTGDNSIFVDVINDPTFQVNTYDAFTGAAGQWSVVTPEPNTGGIALVSGSLLVVGYWRRRPSPAHT